jgi:hypothetical protein
MSWQVLLRLSGGISIMRHSSASYTKDEESGVVIAALRVLSRCGLVQERMTLVIAVDLTQSVNSLPID